MTLFRYLNYMTGRHHLDSSAHGLFGPEVASYLAISLSCYLPPGRACCYLCDGG